MTQPTQEQIQDQLRADAWRQDPAMETVLSRLERNPDDPAITPHLRMASALYRDGKAAARRVGRNVMGGNR